MLPGSRNDQVNRLFAECIGNHIVDSNYKMQLTESYVLRFRQQLADRIHTDKLHKGFDPDSVVNSLVDHH